MSKGKNGKAKLSKEEIENLQMIANSIRSQIGYINPQFDRYTSLGNNLGLYLEPTFNMIENINRMQFTNIANAFGNIASQNSLMLSQGGFLNSIIQQQQESIGSILQSINLNPILELQKSALEYNKMITESLESLPQIDYSHLSKLSSLQIMNTEALIRKNLIQGEIISLTDHDLLSSSVAGVDPFADRSFDYSERGERSLHTILTKCIESIQYEAWSVFKAKVEKKNGQEIWTPPKRPEVGLFQPILATQFRLIREMHAGINFNYYKEVEISRGRIDFIVEINNLGAKTTAIMELKFAGTFEESKSAGLEQLIRYLKERRYVKIGYLISMHVLDDKIIINKEELEGFIIYHVIVGMKKIKPSSL